MYTRMVCVHSSKPTSFSNCLLYLNREKFNSETQKGGMGWVKSLALVLLVAQNASLVLTMRSARTREGEKFSNTAAVFLLESLKGELFEILNHF